MPILQMEIRPGEEFMLSGVAGYLDQYKGPLKTVLDIGAHVGELSILVASRGAEHVWAYEMDYDNHRALHRNVEANNYQGIIKTHYIAVTQYEAGIVLVKAPPIGNTGQRSYCYNNNYPVIATVECMSLNKIIIDFVSQYGPVDFMKMDIEGAEHEVIQSTSVKLLRYIRYIDLDLHDLNFLDYYSGGCDPEDTLDYIIKAGFRLLDRSGDDKAFHVELERI